MENKKINYSALPKQIDLLLSNIDNAEARLQNCRESLEQLKNNSVALNNLLVEEKRRREEAEKKLLRFFQLALDILIIADFDGNFQHVNPAFTTVLGYHQDQFAGSTWLDIVAKYVHPDDREDTLLAIKEAISGNPLYFFEHRCLCQNGTYKWLTWSIMPSVEDGLLYAAAKDITEQKDAQLRKLRKEALNQEREKMVELLECITEPFLALDANWKFVYINKAAEKYLSKNRYELLGKNMWEELPGTLDTHFYKNLRQVQVNKVPLTFEAKALLLGKDFEVHAFPAKDGVSVLAKNITARKRMEKAMLQWGERFAAVFHASPAMLEILSLEEKRYLDVNKCWEKYTGYSRVEVIGQTSDSFDLSGDEATKETRNKAITGQPVVNHPVKFRTKAGEIREVLFSSEIIYIDEKPCLLGVSLDVTDKNRLEEKMAHLNRLKLIGQMAAGISHEIRNPMTTVRGFLQLLSGREKFQEEKSYFDLMFSELDRANQIIADFLSLSKTKPKELKLQDLNVLLENLHPILEAEASHQNKYLAIKTAQLPLIYLDEKEIHQLVLNLYKNGLEAMPVETTIFISTFVEEDNVVLLVKDEGHGIGKNDLEKIGIPFFTTKDYGTGLGIAVCQSIVVRHNGKIEYESDSSGTTVRVLFPIPMETIRS